MTIDRLDHLVLTVADIPATVRFYTKALGMTLESFGEGRHALRFGSQKINLHQHGAEFVPKAKSPTPGSADLCFITLDPIDEYRANFVAHGVEVIEGPIERTGATGLILSIYVRDPDGNLIEISNTL